MIDSVAQPALQQVGRPLSLIPTGLKEAALDSPTFRATAVHFSDQVEIIEKWLDAYVKSTSKLVHDVSSLEETINTFLARSIPPSNVSEAVLDHDYTLLAMRIFGEASREWWSQVISGMKRMDLTIVEPVKAFMNGELRNFKDARKYLEQTQKAFDGTLARYLSQSKTKEPSSLREDAFQVHEARKSYLKASLDFCLLAPQLRSTIDKLLVKVSADQWREMKKQRESFGSSVSKWTLEIDRIRGWSKEMEVGESVFRRELQIARRDIAETASAAFKPSRELEDYNVSTVPFLGSKGPSTVNIQQKKATGPGPNEKQGWLFMRTVSGKPARTTWTRRWFYVKNGIFGWLVTQLGGVQESEKIGVLLCNVKPAFQEDRRFCFEVKTKNSTILVQAETQTQLMEWLDAFESAKNKALEASAKDDFRRPGDIDPAFAITQPSLQEFAANESGTAGLDDTATPIAALDSGIASRASFDVTNPRRVATLREDGETSREHASRLMQKLDMRKSSGLEPPASGIASLISASHNILPIGAPAMTHIGAMLSSKPPPIPSTLNKESYSTLAPSTFANPPASTNLSRPATILTGERGISMGMSDETGGMPSGIMANIWGSSNWGYVNRLEKSEVKSLAIPRQSLLPAAGPLHANAQSIEHDRILDTGLSSEVVESISTSIDPAATQTQTTVLHKKANSVDTEAARSQRYTSEPQVLPVNYPVELKMQDAQFRMLFPDVPRDEKLVLVFRATWNPNEQQEFPGRAYVTPRAIYFYSHHLGLVLISASLLEAIEEVTAAPGKDCDFLFLHLKDTPQAIGNARITIKTFLEPLRLLQMRLNYLIDCSAMDEAPSLDHIISDLVKLETQSPTRSPSMESWEDIPANTPADDAMWSSNRGDRDMKAAIHVEKSLQLGRPKETNKFQLPAKPIVYQPTDMTHKAVERQFEISPKALFHVLFGDRSAVFQLLYHERRAQRIAQGPWVHLEENHMRRDFHFQIDYQDMLRRHRQTNVVDYQVIEVMNDHVCYVVRDMKTPWHLPHHEDFMLVTKIVVTHVAKSKCKLTIYTKVEWSNAPTFAKGLVERQALDDLDLDAVDLGDVVADQVRKLGPQSRTKKAIQIFGHVGQQTSVSLFSAAESMKSKSQIKQRTLTSMLYETTSSFMESAISSLMMWTFAALKKIWEICSTHGILISILILSIGTNIVFTGKDTSVWWTERNAAKFMSRIGVGPNLVMSKAVYLKDLDDALSGAALDINGQRDTKCFQTFRSIANQTDIDIPYQIVGTSFSEVATRSTARRLRRTRQHLGSYRHDLMVAMRVVNNIEKEMLKAEWENWLLDENTRCKQIRSLLAEDQLTAGSSASSANINRSADAQQMLLARQERMDNLRQWQVEYCGSCEREQKLLQDAGKNF